jgi:hypothetical protein
VWCQDNQLSLNVSKTKELIEELSTPPSTSMGL